MSDVAETGKSLLTYFVLFGRRHGLHSGVEIFNPPLSYAPPTIVLMTLMQPG